jgi:hypothetical protein
MAKEQGKLIANNKKAYHDARHNLLGKQVEPGEKFDGK